MILPDMTRAEVMKQLVTMAPELFKRGVAKLAHLNKRPLRKLPKKLTSKYKIQNQEAIINYFPHLEGWTAWIKFRIDTMIAGKIWKDYPMYALIEVSGDKDLDILVHRKHALDRYNERLNLGLNNVDDILEEISYSDSDRVNHFEDVDDKLKLVIGNSPNGAFIGFVDMENGYKEVYTFITNEMLKKRQKPEPTDELMEAIAHYEKIVGKKFANEILEILNK